MSDDAQAGIAVALAVTMAFVLGCNYASSCERERSPTELRCIADKLDQCAAIRVECTNDAFHSCGDAR